MSDVKDELRSITRDIGRQAAIMFGLLALLWLIEIVNALVFDHNLIVYGIQPRTQEGLRGILFAPFLHGSWSHLIANSAPFLALGWLVLGRSVREFVIVTIAVMLTSGIGAWMFGASGSVHVGASGVIFGYFGFLLARGIFDRRLTSILLSLIVGTVYGYLLIGVLPTQPSVSWQGHLFGFLGGVLVAYILSRWKNRT
jgi:membrane associated rhomboid family serine protease